MQASTILVVDDTDIVRFGIVTLLRAFGYQTDEASDGLTALEKASKSKYGAILLDYDMPHLDGLNCAVQIRKLERESGRRTPIIGISASDIANIREACLEVGMDDYVDKACSIKEMKDVLAKWTQAEPK